MIKFESMISHILEHPIERRFEVMKTPEIVAQEERGALLMSLLLKAVDPEWGETETLLAKEVASYFKTHPVPTEIMSVVRDFQRQNIDEETLYNLALTYQHPERAEHVLAMTTKHKPHVADPENVRTKCLEMINAFDQIFSISPLSQKINAEIEKDKMLRTERIDETRARIDALIDFYKPDTETSDIKRVNLVPTDPVYRKNSGRAFSVFPGEQIIICHIDNIDNQDHEFSHGIINPIIEKLSEQLDDVQKEKVSALASSKLKRCYGDEYFSLLCEEFIRTYNDVLRKGEQPQTCEGFMQKVSDLTDEQFQHFLANNGYLVKRFSELGIQTVDEFKRRSREYFERFEQNQLQDLIFRFYQNYINRPDKDGENFEQFVLKEFPDRLSKYDV
jgi:hypothetical protein